MFQEMREKHHQGTWERVIIGCVIFTIYGLCWVGMVVIRVTLMIELSICSNLTSLCLFVHTKYLYSSPHMTSHDLTWSYSAASLATYNSLLATIANASQLPYSWKKTMVRSNIVPQELNFCRPHSSSPPFSYLGIQRCLVHDLMCITLGWKGW